MKRNSYVWSLLVLLLICGSQPSCKAEKASLAEKRDHLNQSEKYVCDTLSKIETIPFVRDASGIDKNYDSVLSKKVPSEAVARCISDTRKMDDPRQSPNRVNNFLVGDAAYIVFVRKEGISFEKFLPEKVAIEMNKKGTNAYFEWISSDNARANLSSVCERFAQEQKKR